MLLLLGLLDFILGFRAFRLKLALALRLPACLPDAAPLFNFSIGMPILIPIPGTSFVLAVQ